MTGGNQLLRGLRIGVCIGAAAWLAGWLMPAYGDDAKKVFDDAKAIGVARANEDGANVSNGKAEAVVKAVVPGYTDKPKESTYYASQDTATPTANLSAACAATPTDPTCSGIKTATPTRPPTTLSPASPALAGQEAARNPTSVLGDIANTYNACAVGGEMTTPATFDHKTCSLDTGAWTTEPCTKTLSVSPVEKYSCTAGSVIASKEIDGKMSVKAFCNPKAGANISFTFDAWGGHGSCAAPLNATLDLSVPQPQGGNPPPLIGGLAPHWHGGCFPVSVYWEGAGCSGGACSLKVHFVQSPGLQPNYTCTTPGTVRGSDVMFWDWTPPSSASSTCYYPFADVESAAGRPGGWGNAAGQDAFWAEYEPGVASGWGWVGEHYETTLSFPQPTFTPASGDTWANTCTTQEDRTPLLAKDGLTSSAPPWMPTVMPPGTSQCVRSSSVCLDGPSTKVIDGVSVSRECWSYANTFECTSVAASSTCTGAPFDTCSRSGEPTCLLKDTMGRCLTAELGYDCKSADAVFTPSLNCGDASYCTGGSCWDTTKTANTSVVYALAQMEAHMQAGTDMEVDGATIQIFKGQDRRCHMDLFGIDNCCTDSTYITSCSTEEQDTYKKRDAGQCHEIGEYCSNKTALGICVEKTKTHCCFSSLLARVIQEQGRVQLARGWGDAKNPVCTGFTPDELTALDWSKFDLSEFYAQIHPTTLDQGVVTNDAKTTQPACYYGQGKC